MAGLRGEMQGSFFVRFRTFFFPNLAINNTLYISWDDLKPLVLYDQKQVRRCDQAVPTGFA